MSKYYVGQRLKVGTILPEPPKQHKRKWREWEDNQYLAEVVEVFDNVIKLKDLDASNIVASFIHYIKLDDPSVTLAPKPDEISKEV